MNVAKPPLDDLERPHGGRDGDRPRPDQRDPQQRRLRRSPTVRSTPRSSGYLKEPGFPKYNLQEGEEARRRVQGGARRAVQRRARAHQRPGEHRRGQLIKEQLAKAGIDATLKQDDQTAFIIAAVGGNFSIMLWRQHPGDDPDGQYVWWNTGSLVNFGKFADPDAAGADRPGPQRDRPGRAQEDLPGRQQAVRRRRCTTCGRTTPTGYVGRAEERAGPRRAAAPRRGREAAVHLRTPTLARSLGFAVDQHRMGTIGPAWG